MKWLKSIQQFLFNRFKRKTTKTQKITLIDELHKHLSTHETLQLALVEAVHRFYYDNCFDPYTNRPYDTPEFKTISNLAQTLHCANPDWRYRLTKRLSRYKACNEPTFALFIDSRPKQITKLELTFTLNYGETRSSETLNESGI